VDGGVMDIRYSVEPFPHVILDGFYGAEELAEIGEELRSLSKVAMGPDATLSAKGDDGDLLKKNRGVFLPLIYKDLRASPTFIATRKIFDKELIKVLCGLNLIFRYMPITNWDGTLVQFYANGDKYGSHHDTAVFTLITNVSKEPRAYTGGVLRFAEYDYAVDLQHNQSILFPSMLKHEVTEVVTEVSDMVDGRVTISMFMGMNQQA
jgi:hypothetical protein